MNPRVILADEPTGNLDSRTSIEVMALFQELGRARNHHRPGHARAGHRGARCAQYRPAGRAHSLRYAACAPARGSLCGEPAGNNGWSEEPSIMNPWHTIQIALQALRRNKLRSFLTMLGVIIGVFAVIAMVAAGDGATAQVQNLFASIGTNMLIVLPGASNQGGAIRRIRHAADADLGRSESHARRSAHGALRGGRPAQGHAGAERRPATGTPASTELRPTTSPFAPGMSRKAFAVHRQRARSAGQVRRSGHDRGAKALRRQRQPDRANHSHQQRAVPGDRRAAIQGSVDERAGQRRRGFHSARPPTRPTFRAAYRNTSTARS